MLHIAYTDYEALRAHGEIQAKSMPLDGYKVRIPFDVAPKPFEVPRRSISSDYQRSMHTKL